MILNYSMQEEVCRSDIDDNVYIGKSKQASPFIIYRLMA
jgi:hypothetical protein